MLFSKYFGLSRTQSTLDFLDIDVEGDIPVFVDPTAIRSLATSWGDECAHLLRNYFQCIVSCIKDGDHVRARYLLSVLNERNEFHLGFSKRKSKGHALGPKYAKKVWESFSSSKAAATGLLEDLEDSVLFVDGIGPDLLSDAICNIIRGPLIAYTQNACNYYGVPLTEVDSGPVWNPIEEKFESNLVELPETEFGRIVLVPKVIVRVAPLYSANSYYRHYLMPLLQEHHKSINSGLVRVIKSGKRKGMRIVTKKSLYAKYGAKKLDAAKLTVTHPSAYVKYKELKRREASTPLGHSALAQIENIPVPNLQKLISDLQKIPTGKTDSGKFEDAVEGFLSALFYPALAFPQKQFEIHEGRKRIDITYSNIAKSGFFSWLGQHYPAGHIFVECKNYGKEVGNPELDQLSSRFGPTRGQFGILVVRSLENRELMLKRCFDTARDQRGYVVVIEDADLKTLASQRAQLLQTIFDDTIAKQFRALIN